MIPNKWVLIQFCQQTHTFTYTIYTCEVFVVKVTNLDTFSIEMFTVQILIMNKKGTCQVNIIYEYIHRRIQEFENLGLQPTITTYSSHSCNI
jgi:hypothetical protein